VVVARFLSPEWLAEMEAASIAGESGPTDERVVLQQVVTGGPDGEVAYVVEIDDAGVRMTRGRRGDADVTITEDYETAVAIHAGTLSLPDAFMAGRVKVAGNLAALLARQETLAAGRAVQGAS
jgi:putative sterol carrier protein